MQENCICARNYFVLVLILFILIHVLVLSLPANEFIADQSTEVLTIDSKTKRKVLFWTPIYEPYFKHSLKDIFIYCAVNNCAAVTNKNENLVEDYSAIIFDASVYNKKLHGVPNKRNAHQRYVFTSLKPFKKVRLKGFENFFNWTMTFRKNSYIWMPFGAIEEKAMDFDLEHVQLRKPKLLATLGRNVQFHPSLMTENDIYRSCDLLCLDEIEQKYKFVLMQEENLCTETFYELYSRNVVPIINASLKYVALPERSYVNVEKFHSLQDLAKYLERLDRNHEEYLRFFQWKRRYAVQLKGDMWQRGICDLCEKLNSPFEPSSFVYDNIEEWWHESDGNICK